MSRDLNDLIPEFKDKVVQLLQNCDQSGYKMRQFYTLRTPFEQAILWRQSRSSLSYYFQIEVAERSTNKWIALLLKHENLDDGKVLVL